MNKDGAIVLGLMAISVGAAFVSGMFLEQAKNVGKSKQEYLKGVYDGLEIAKGLVSHAFEEQVKARNELKETQKEETES